MINDDTITTSHQVIVDYMYKRSHYKSLYPPAVWSHSIQPISSLYQALYDKDNEDRLTSIQDKQPVPYSVPVAVMTGC